MLGAVLFLGLAGCGTPEPAEPTPTPAFSSEAEAFAAAEETYRAYVEAVNLDRADPKAADPQQYLIGSALEADIDTQRMLADADVDIVGPNQLTSFEARSSSADRTRVKAIVCIDASQSRVVNASGADVTPIDRDSSVALDVTFLLDNDVFAIAESAASSEHSC